MDGMPVGSAPGAVICGVPGIGESNTHLESFIALIGGLAEATRREREQGVGGLIDGLDSAGVPLPLQAAAAAVLAEAGNLKWHLSLVTETARWHGSPEIPLPIAERRPMPPRFHPALADAVDRTLRLIEHLATELRRFGEAARTEAAQLDEGALQLSKGRAVLSADESEVIASGGRA